MQVQTKVMNNYMGIGVDAKVSLEFDRLRTKFPHWFKSQIGEYRLAQPVRCIHRMPIQFALRALSNNVSHNLQHYDLHTLCCIA